MLSGNKGLLFKGLVKKVLDGTRKIVDRIQNEDYTEVKKAKREAREVKLEENDVKRNALEGSDAGCNCSKPRRAVSRTPHGCLCLSASLHNPPSLLAPRTPMPNL